MKLKIVQKGWAGFKGNLHGVPFEDGVSARDVTHLEARRIGASLMVENLEGEQVGPGKTLVDIKNTAAPVMESVPVEPSAPRAKPVEPAQKEAPKPAAQRYTLEQLAEIADKSGIDGLRKVADQMGVRGRGIRELIDKILETQAAL